MSNSFPPIPPDLVLASIEYDATFPTNAAPSLIPDLSFTGVSTSVIALGAFGVGGLVAFYFDTPGSFGAFDQAAAETAVKMMATDCCQFITDITGIPLATVQAGVTITRRWTWTDTTGSTARYADTMVYP